jgi:hypothetical protein
MKGAVEVLTKYVAKKFGPRGTAVKVDAPAAVTTDRNCTSEKATGHAVANVQGYHANLTVALNLRSLPPGTYFLATTMSETLPRISIH